MSATIRRAEPGDEQAVYDLLRGLAEFEDLLGKFHLTLEDVRRDVFGADPALKVALAFVEGLAAPVGLASWYWTYSSFAAKRGLFIEDIFVQPAWRGHGLGKAFFAFLARETLRVGGHRLDWLVLNWNEKAIAFYQSLGGKPVQEWQIYRLDGAAMEALAR